MKTTTRPWLSLLLIAVAVFPIARAEDALLLIEGPGNGKWENAVRGEESGKSGDVLRWNGYPSGRTFSWNAETPLDLSSYDQLSFNLKTEPSGEIGVAVQLLSPGKNGRGDYLWTKVTHRADGWKTHSIPLRSLTKTREGDLSKVTALVLNGRFADLKPVGGVEVLLTELRFEKAKAASPRRVDAVPFEEIRPDDERLKEFDRYPDHYRLDLKAFVDHPAVKPWPSIFLGGPLTEADVVGPDGIVVPDFRYAGVRGGIPVVPVAVDLASFGARPGDEISIALQKAVDATVKAGGGAILIRAGEYWLDGPFTITNGGVVLRGEGKGRTVIRYAAALKTKELKIVSPAFDGQAIPANKSGWLEAMADCDNLKELRLLVDGKVLARQIQEATETGRTSAVVIGPSFARLGLKAGEHVLRAEIVWRDGTEESLERRFVLDASLPDTHENFGPSHVFSFQGPGRAADAVDFLLVKDAKRGDRVLHVESAAGLAPGDVVLLKAEPTPAFIERIASSNRVPRQVMLVVEEVKENSVRFNQPVRIDFPVSDRSSFSKRGVLSRAGIEDLTIDNTDPRGRVWHHGIGGRNLLDCWVKNVEVIRAGRNPTQFNYAKFCAVVDSRLDDAWFKDGGGTAYVFWDWAWDCLMDDITGGKLRHAPNFQWSASGCVIRNARFEDSDAQFHCGYAYENLMENCRVRSRKGNGSYGFGIYTQKPEAKIHGTLGPRNVVWNCDVEAEMPAVYCGGRTEGWIFAYNRFVTGKGPSVIARHGCFDYVWKGNWFIQKNPLFFGGIYLATSDCLDWRLEGNRFYGDLSALVTGMARPGIDKGNSVLPLEQAPEGRPEPPVPSLFDWQRAKFPLERAKER